MAIGLASPLQVTAKGGALTVSGSDHVKQLVLTALRDCSSENPFQDLGISDALIFDINDAHEVGKLRLRFQQIFAVFQAEQLARLGKGDDAISFSQVAEGELRVDLKYIDLETDKPDEVDVKHSAGKGWS